MTIKLKIITSIIFATVISACSPVDKVLKKENVFAISFINDKEHFVVFDVATGKIVPPCSERPTDDFKACRYPLGVEDDLATKSRAKSMEQSDPTPTSSKVKILGYHNIIITDWEGSHCRTYKNKITGEITEVCNPWLKH